MDLVDGYLAGSGCRNSKQPGIFFREMAELWIVSDQVMAPVDALAVFGGGLDVRPFAAAEYYRHGLVNKILISNVRPSPAETLGIIASHTELNRLALITLGVPESVIETFGSNVTSTRDEAYALREWAVANHAHSIIVPTEIFSARRIRWILDRVFVDSRVKIWIPALNPPNFTAADWWRHEEGLIAFQNEFIKYWYYRIRY